MLTYNTQLKKLVLPEYGRNIQNMVDHCLTLEDRDERTQCARAIVKAMGNLLPELRDPENNDHKLWDHLMIMSGFALDIDFPCDVISAEALTTSPEPVHRITDHVKYRHYGRILPQMIEKAASMEEGEERMLAIGFIANQMKKLMLSVNKDGVEDSKIFSDLYEMSGGKIKVEPETLILSQYQDLTPAPGKKKKKK